MNLLLNAEALRPPMTGIGNYTFHLLEQFVAGSLVEDVHCFSGTGWLSGEQQLAVSTAIKAQDSLDNDSAVDLAIAKVRGAVGKIPGTQSLYDAIMDRRFEQISKKVPEGVYHETNYILKPYAGPCITTIHDLSHVHYPEFHPEHVVARLDDLLPRTLDRADLIITVSDIVRDEILEQYDVPESRVVTVYEGVDALYVPRTEDETSAVLSEFGLQHKNYVLLVATLEPRKGIDVLLDAWSLLPKSLRQEFPLVLTGSSGWRNEGIRSRIAALVAEGTARHLGYVAAEKLPVLFSGAAVFTYPSIYEGFGLPVLDAMSSGVPVICRAGTSMAEFSDGACMLCETGEAEELAARLAALLESREEQQLWAQKGVAKSAQFSWERCARETAALYRSLT